MGKWLKKNAIHIAIAALIAGIIYVRVFRRMGTVDGLEFLWYCFLVAAGIGFLIFIHELGHFLAAKLCNVKVETFSVGFGPPIPGCHFRWGETLYKLAWFPLGGYVKMAGEYPNEQMEEEVRNDPRAFMNKSVWQRMIIISAGVVANVIVGMLCFIYVYNAGRDQLAPEVGFVEPGSPAALAGMEAGSRILAIDGNEKPTFEDLLAATLFSAPGKTEIALKWRTPTGEIREGAIVPRKLKTDKRPMIGVGRPRNLSVFDPKKSGLPIALPGSPAATAEKSFEPRDELVALRRKDKEAITLKDGWHYTMLEGRFRDKDIVVTVKRGNKTEEITVAPRRFYTFGLRFEPGEIVGLEDARYRPASAQGFQIGDVIMAVNDDWTFDALRLPDLIWGYAQGIEPIELTVLRGGELVDIDINPAEIRERGTWEEQQPSNDYSPISIPGLGVAYRVHPVISSIDDKSPAKGKLEPGDRIVAVTYATDPAGEKWETKELGDIQWSTIFLQHFQSAKSEKVILKVVDKSGHERPPVELDSYEHESWAYPDRGLRREQATVIVRADDMLDAIGLGLNDTRRKIGQLYLGLNSMARGYVDAKDSVTGPLGLLEVTYRMAESGWTELIFIIGFISINLAVVNFLPIPVLDGGHMVFLIVEKLRGKPASERVLIIANVVGLVLILSLMLTVILLDARKFGWLDFLG